MTVLTTCPVAITTTRHPSDRSARATGHAPAARIARAALTLTTDALLRQRVQLPTDHPDQRRIRAHVIEANLPLARRLARRYAGRGELLDDLYQVAAVGLVKAVDRYDPSWQTPFASFAIPTIIGDLKQHFRDTSRGIRISRGIQDLSRLVAAATHQLSQQLRHDPTSVELAEHLKVGVGDVLIAAGVAHAYYIASLNARSSTADSAEPIDLAGGTDPSYAGVDDRLLLRPFLAALSTRERRVLVMRFYRDMTQSQIAAEVGLSQMHVSRLLTRTLAQLRAAMLRPPRLPPTRTAARSTPRWSQPARREGA
jgi:RNA polymerase sigma-B factor